MKSREVSKADAIGNDFDRKLTGDQQLQGERASQMVLDLKKTGVFFPEPPGQRAP